MITGVGPLRFFLYPNIMTMKEEKIYLSKCRDGQTMQGWPVWTWPNVEASAPHGCAGDRRREIWPPTASRPPLKKVHRPGSKPSPPRHSTFNVASLAFKQMLCRHCLEWESFAGAASKVEKKKKLFGFLEQIWIIHLRRAVPNLILLTILNWIVLD